MRIETIEDLLDEFDFQRVRQTMEALDWQWVSAVDGIPSFGELRRQARELLEDVYNKPPSPFHMGGCGGFEATRTMETDDLNKYISLKFIVSEFNNYD